MIAYIKELSVNRNEWLDEQTFKDGVSPSCQKLGAGITRCFEKYTSIDIVQ